MTGVAPLARSSGTRTRVPTRPIPPHRPSRRREASRREHPGTARASSLPRWPAAPRRRRGSPRRRLPRSELQRDLCRVERARTSAPRSASRPMCRQNTNSATGREYRGSAGPGKDSGRRRTNSSLSPVDDQVGSRVASLDFPPRPGHPRPRRRSTRGCGRPTSRQFSLIPVQERNVGRSWTEVAGSSLPAPRRNDRQAILRRFQPDDEVDEMAKSESRPNPGSGLRVRQRAGGEPGVDERAGPGRESAPVTPR